MNAQSKTYDSVIEDLIDRSRLIDSGSAYYTKLLVTDILSEFFRYEYPETKWANEELITIDSSPNPGSVAVAWNMISQTGDPGDGIVSAEADDIPQADIAIEQQLNTVYNVPVAIQWTDDDLERAEMQGLYSVSVEKGAAARTYWLQKINNLIVKGSTKHNFVGVSNMPGRKNIAASAPFSTLTSDQILTAFEGLFDAVYGDTKAVLMPDTVAMPTTISAKMRAPTNALAVKSTLDYLRDAYPEVTNWVFDPAMNDAGQGDTPCVMMYRNEPARLRGLMPLYMSPKGIQEKGMKYQMIFRSKFAGVACPYPGNIATLYGV